ncbi:MAG: flagellar basal body P-ring formation chaperone FlgA [Verrucomicrobiota bacterium]
MNIRFLFRWLVCLPLLGCGGLAPRANASQPAAWELPAQVQAGGGGIFPGDLHFPSAEVPHVRLFDSPPFGKSVVFTRAQIEAAVRAALGESFAVTWRGAEKVTATRRSRQLGGAELCDWLTAVLQKEQARERGELELRLARAWTEIAVPDGPLELRVLDLPSGGLSPHFVARFDLRAGAESIGSWQVAVQAKLWREVLVAHRAASHGLPLREVEFGLERRDVLTARDALTALPGPVEALEMAAYVQPGAPLTARSIRFRPVITRGKVVDAVVQEGSLEISVKVEALEDGLPGQTVRVRNLKSKREFRGKVQNEQTILVVL